MVTYTRWQQNTGIRNSFLVKKKTDQNKIRPSPTTTRRTTKTDASFFFSTMNESANTNTNTTKDVRFSLPTRLFHDDARKIVLRCVDCHAAGEPARVVLGGCAELLKKNIRSQHRKEDTGGDDTKQAPASAAAAEASVVVPLSAYEKRRFMMKNLDFVRRLLIEEPRGYPCQNVNFVFMEEMSKEETTDDDTLDGKIQYVIGEQKNVWPMMSGHNTMCVATALIECGVLPKSWSSDIVSPSSTCFVQFDLEAPCGMVHIDAKCRIETGIKQQHGSSVKAESITIINQPAFVEVMDLIVDVPLVGRVKCDIAWGSGMWYCVVDINQSVFRSSSYSSNEITENSGRRNEAKTSLEIDPSCAKSLCKIGERIKVACREQHPVQHPTLDYEGVDILVYIEQPSKHMGQGKDDDDEEAEPSDTAQGSTTWVARNTVVMSNTKLIWDESDTHTAMLDRSPCGTGTCAVMAVHHARGLMKVNDTLIHKSILGTKFRGKILKETPIDDGSESWQEDDTTMKKKTRRTGIIPSVEGSAYITQYSQVVVDPDDPFQQGYSLGDIW